MKRPRLTTSGGEEGALKGPSIMPGGQKEAHELVAPIFEAIAAKVDGAACTTYIGPDGAGHLELETKTNDYMGVTIPTIEIQLQPGRDVVGLIEAAANNWYLKQQGYSAAEEFIQRLESDMENKGKTN